MSCLTAKGLHFCPSSPQTYTAQPVPVTWLFSIEVKQQNLVTEKEQQKTDEVTSLLSPPNCMSSQHKCMQVTRLAPLLPVWVLLYSRFHVTDNKSNSGIYTSIHFFYTYMTALCGVLISAQSLVSGKTKKYLQAWVALPFHTWHVECWSQFHSV